MKDYKSIRIFCYCVCKNESDIIYEVLESASDWAYKIFVWDNDSTDHTLDEIEKASQDFSNVIFCGVRKDSFSSALRGQLIQEVKAYAKPGDWWCKLDADETYFNDPRRYLARVEANANCVWGTMIDFKFTDQDYKQWQKDPAKYESSKVHGRLRYYECVWIERRFFKHMRFLFWPKGRRNPPLAVMHSSIRIPFANYRYRYPAQIKKRVGLRRMLMNETGIREFPHEMTSEQLYRHWGRRVRRNINARLTPYGDPILDEKILDHKNLEIWDGQSEEFLEKREHFPDDYNPSSANAVGGLPRVLLQHYITRKYKKFLKLSYQ